jgi:hypothetical protein
MENQITEGKGMDNAQFRLIEHHRHRKEETYWVLRTLEAAMSACRLEEAETDFQSCKAQLDNWDTEHDYGSASGVKSKLEKLVIIAKERLAREEEDEKHDMERFNKQKEETV